MSKKPPKKPVPQTFSSMLRQPRHHLKPDSVIALFAKVDKARVEALAALLSNYISVNLPKAIERREALADYRTNPYVLLTSARIMDLHDPGRFADFLFNNKLYMGLETSFGKSIEATFVSAYPLDTRTTCKWIDPPEKLAEFRTYDGLDKDEKAKRRTSSVWREIDKSSVIGETRYMTSIKSGPNCINDTQVQGMTNSILSNHHSWMAQTRKTYPGVKKLDIIIGITYGTDRTTNNKENQILVKLLANGFIEEDRVAKPGVLMDAKTRMIRVYRRIGKEFWAMIGNPASPSTAEFIFLEVLLALSKALSLVIANADLETKINLRIKALISALGSLMFPRNSLPDWVRSEFSEKELFWFATAISSFYDEGV